MIDFKVSRRYARALFGLSGQDQKLEALDQDFQKARALVEKHPEITHLVLNSTISRAEKEDFIDKILGTDLSKLLIDFVKVLIRKRRFSHLRLIQEEFHRLFEKKQGIQEVQVLTPVPLPQLHEQKLLAALEKNLKARVRLRSATHPEMIGGLILRFDGKELDLSYRTRLQELRQTLMK